MARRAARTYVLAHAAKSGRAPFHAWATLPPGWTLVTDASAAEAEVAAFTERGTRVVLAEPVEEPARPEGGAE